MSVIIKCDHCNCEPQTYYSLNMNIIEKQLISSSYIFEYGDKDFPVHVCSSCFLEIKKFLEEFCDKKVIMKCPKCHGSGKSYTERLLCDPPRPAPCSHCGGSGFMKEGEVNEH